MEGDNADIIYLDFCKAFDMVSHYCWLVKMKKLGILKIVNIVWYFLRDGTMKVKIGKNYSETQNIASSVPQDFRTVTFFCFLIFINGLSYDIKMEIKLFADDV